MALLRSHRRRGLPTAICTSLALRRAAHGSWACRPAGVALASQELVHQASGGAGRSVVLRCVRPTVCSLLESFISPQTCVCLACEAVVAAQRRTWKVPSVLPVSGEMNEAGRTVRPRVNTAGGTYARTYRAIQGSRLHAHNPSVST